MPRRIAFLTLEDAADFVIDDDLAVAELQRRGWDAAEVPWSVPTDWSTYDVVLIRSTWDYAQRSDEFLDTLRAIEASGAQLENPVRVVEWNIDKCYLRELEARGVPVVPSVWGNGGSASVFSALFATLQDREIVLKPNISGGAKDTFRLHAPLSDMMLQQLVDTFDGRDWFAQPFVRSVVTEGEYSLFYFDGRYSHAIQKVPKPGDFRVQEEHGGEIIAITATPELQRVAEEVLASIAPVPFQARIDLIRLDDGRLALMEAELIEPSLYLRMDTAAPARFADAIEALHARRPHTRA
jgi:glutathione synthase/RimK-type ligase-like ATP-grasp enzyme